MKNSSSKADIPTICDLFQPSYPDLTYSEHLRKCAEIDITLSDADIELIEKDTRTQARGTAFFQHRARRIGVSSSWAASHTKPAMPSQSLIKSMCYPHLFKVNSKAIIHGRRNETPAIDAYSKVMSQTHRDFIVKHCVMIIDKHHPWIHATPDVMTSCSCRGEGCCEVKCPYSIQNCNFEAYVRKKDSCLEIVNNTFRLKRSRQYYYQVQQQLFVTGSKYCDFVMCSFLNKQCFSWREFTRTPPIGILFFPSLPRCRELVYNQKFLADGIQGSMILLLLHQ